jgi:hypothetical protein
MGYATTMHTLGATIPARQRKREEHGRLDRERHSRRSLIEGQATPCVHPARMSMNHEYPNEHE